MVIRKSAATLTPAQLRRQAQRRLAREIKTGTFKPSPIGAKAREKAKDYRAEKSRLIKIIRDYKNSVYGSQPKFNQQRSDRNVRINPRTKKERGIEELRRIAAVIEQIIADGQRDEFFWAWDNVFEDEDYASALYYH